LLAWWNWQTRWTENASSVLSSELLSCPVSPFAEDCWSSKRDDVVGDAHEGQAGGYVDLGAGQSGRIGMGVKIKRTRNVEEGRAVFVQCVNAFSKSISYSKRILWKITVAALAQHRAASALTCSPTATGILESKS
jgi:hypothetical protein